VILDLQELETLLVLVRERHAYVLKHTQAPKAVRDKLGRLENKIEARMKQIADESEADELRGAHAFEARKDGSLVIYATMPDGDGEPIRIEPQRVRGVLCACGDALAREPSVR
jgi:hypothetical protein